MLISSHKKLLLPVIPWFFFVVVGLTCSLLWIKGVFPAIDASSFRALCLLIMLSAGPGLLSAIVVGTALLLITQRTTFFHSPFDIGRAISLGGVLGGLIHPASAVLIFYLIHHGRPAPFWIATATISGVLSGALVVSIIFWRLSKGSPASRRSLSKK